MGSVWGTGEGTTWVPYSRFFRFSVFSWTFPCFPCDGGLDAKQTTSVEADRSIGPVLAEQTESLRPRLCLAGIRPSKRIPYMKPKYIQRIPLGQIQFCSPGKGGAIRPWMYSKASPRDSQIKDLLARQSLAPLRASLPAHPASAEVIRVPRPPRLAQGGITPSRSHKFSLKTWSQGICLTGIRSSKKNPVHETEVHPKI